MKIICQKGNSSQETLQSHHSRSTNLVGEHMFAPNPLGWCRLHLRSAHLPKQGRWACTLQE